MKRSVSVLLTVLPLAALLCACSPDSPAPEESETTAAPTVTLISADTGAEYTIVRADTSPDIAIDDARTIQSAIEDATGQKLTLLTDWYKDTMGAPPQPKEILIGETNRDASAVSTRANDSRDWSVRLTGETIVIWGGSDEAIASAVGHFLTNFVLDGAVTMPEGYEYTYLHEWPVSAISVGDHPITDYQIVTPSGCSAILTAAAETVCDYLTENVGFTPDIVSDAAAKKQRDCEILIGNTNRSPAASSTASVILDGTRIALTGSSDAGVYAAAKMLCGGSALSAAGGAFTVVPVAADTVDLLTSGFVDVMKSYTDQRAKQGREKHLADLMQYEKKDIADADVYANSAVTVLYMPEDEVTGAQLAFANRMIRKVAGYMTTDIAPSKKDRVKGECDFAANRLVRALYAPEGRLESETADAVKRFFLHDDFESMYFSENHMLMFRCARYLAACYFENETFAQYGMTGAALRQQEHDYLVEFLQFRAKRGWGEFDSMGYSIENFLSVLNLYDCAPDEDIRTLAQMTLDTLLLTMLCDSTENGMFGGAHSRSYDSLTTDMRCRFFWVYQFYFGEHSFDDVPASYKEIGLSNTPLAFVSDYRPADIVYAIAADRTYPFSNYETSHNPTTAYKQEEYGYVNKYTYNTDLYSIGCVNHQDEYPASSPDKKNEDTQQMNFSLVFANNSRANITFHHPGSVSGHEYWYGDAQCNCNHFFGHGNTVVGIFFIPGNAGDYDFIHAYVPKVQYDEVIEQKDKNCLFVRLGDAYAAVFFSDSYSWKAGSSSEIIVHDGTRRSNIRIGVACRAGDKAEYGSFDAFVAAMEKEDFAFDRDSLTVSFGEVKLALDYTKQTGALEHAFLDGAEQTFPTEYAWDSPYMKAKLDSGVIEVTYRDTTRVMDFMNITDTVR